MPTRSESTLSDRKHARQLNARKAWRCDGCEDTIHKFVRYEHSLTANRGYDIRLCLRCAASVPAKEVAHA